MKFVVAAEAVAGDACARHAPHAAVAAVAAAVVAPTTTAAAAAADTSSSLVKIYGKCVQRRPREYRDPLAAVLPPAPHRTAPHRSLVPLCRADRDEDAGLNAAT